MTMEWICRFPSVDRPAIIAISTLFAVGAVAAAVGGVLASSPSTSISSGALAVSFAGSAAAVAVHSGLFTSRSNRIEARDGAVIVDSDTRMQPAFYGTIGIAGAVVLFVTTLITFGEESEPPAPPVLLLSLWGGLVVSGMLLIAAALSNPFKRTLVISPDHWRIRAGRFEASIPWDSITGYRPFEGTGRPRLVTRGMFSGITLTTDDRARYSRLSVPAVTGSSNIPLTGFTVDEDTLYNVIVALHEHPALRPLVWREECAALFEGPPREVRQSMEPGVIREPWGRRIREVLADGTPS